MCEAQTDAYLNCKRQALRMNQILSFRNLTPTSKAYAERDSFGTRFTEMHLDGFQSKLINDFTDWVIIPLCSARKLIKAHSHNVCLTHAPVVPRWLHCCRGRKILHCTLLPRPHVSNGVYVNHPLVSAAYQSQPVPNKNCQISSQGTQVTIALAYLLIQRRLWGVLDGSFFLRSCQSRLRLRGLRLRLRHRHLQRTPRSTSGSRGRLKFDKNSDVSKVEKFPRSLRWWRPFARAGPRSTWCQRLCVRNWGRSLRPRGTLRSAPRERFRWPRSGRWHRARGRTWESI